MKYRANPYLRNIIAARAGHLSGRVVGRHGWLRMRASVKKHDQKLRRYNCRAVGVTA